jgi:hypothetical protein
MSFRVRVPGTGDLKSLGAIPRAFQGTSAGTFCVYPVTTGSTPVAVDNTPKGP